MQLMCLSFFLFVCLFVCVLLTYFLSFFAQQSAMIFFKKWSRVIDRRFELTKQVDLSGLFLGISNSNLDKGAS